LNLTKKEQDSKFNGFPLIANVKPVSELKEQLNPLKPLPLQEIFYGQQNQEPDGQNDGFSLIDSLQPIPETTESLNPLKVMKNVRISTKTCPINYPGRLTSLEKISTESFLNKI